MSAQGVSLGRRTVHLPIWPVAALVAAAVAVLGMTLFDDVRPEASVTTVTTQDRLANSSAAIREQGSVAPALPTIDPAVLESSSAAIREQGASIPLPSIPGLEYPSIPGLEYPGAWEIARSTTVIPGLENPGAYADDRVTPPIERHEPITFDGEACHQCR